LPTHGAALVISSEASDPMRSAAILYSVPPCSPGHAAWPMSFLFLFFPFFFFSFKN
jgi:hypothetical protein